MRLCRKEKEHMAILIRQLHTLSSEPGELVQTKVNGDNAIAGTPIETVLGLEGAGSAHYFSCFGKMLTDQEQWPFAGRIRRPPTDAVNALLSFGYALLAS